MNILKHTFILLSLLFFLAGHLYGQAVFTDSLNMRFSFQSGSSCFMRQFHENESMLDKARKFMPFHRNSIEQDSITFHVYGYCGDGGTTALRQERAKQMSNYVKGELINSRLLKEKHFKTKNA